jgi:hypothetical protein
MNLLKKAHAWGLGGWAILNMGTGGILAFVSQEKWTYFHLMNGCWGLVNAGVALFLYFHHHTEMALAKPLLRQMDIQRHAEKAILFNAGLDIAFVFAGVTLCQHGQGAGRGYAAPWLGFGASVILQGGFLLLLDTLFYRLHVRNRSRVHPLWEQLMEKQQTP